MRIIKITILHSAQVLLKYKTTVGQWEGGIVLTMKNSIRPGINIIKSEYNRIIWAKLDKTFLDKKIHYILVLHIP